MTTVVALGGNALSRAGERGNGGRAARQPAPDRAGARAAARGRRWSITHGNGPQVGNELLRQERAAAEAPPLPLWLAVAQTQAEIGALIEAEVAPAARRPVACLLTHVVVAADDPAFGAPDEADRPVLRPRARRDARAGARLERRRGRRPRLAARRSLPAPLEVVELGAVRRLLETGTLVVACGGGGIPVVRRDGPLRRRRRGDRQGPRLGPARGGARSDAARHPHRRRRGRARLRHPGGGGAPRAGRGRGRGDAPGASGRLDATEGRGCGPVRARRAARR